ncbi:hypothetical protein [Streptomyces sp. NPDC020951]|uniref:hypothetical protein n=1 Tax=Streptomyces sp. NPDC020951 TaxID=3365104 RepID=UPI0037B7150D
MAAASARARLGLPHPLDTRLAGPESAYIEVGPEYEELPASSVGDGVLDETVTGDDTCIVMYTPPAGLRHDGGLAGRGLRGPRRRGGEGGIGPTCAASALTRA